jgi:hypothetical protein
VKFLILIAAFFVVGCTQEDMKPHIDAALGRMWGDVASCQVLAECLGYERGVVKAETHQTLTQTSHEQFYEWQIKGGFACELGLPTSPVKRLVDLREVAPMLRGCEQKKCETCDQTRKDDK